MEKLESVDSEGRVTASRTLFEELTDCGLPLTFEQRERARTHRAEVIKPLLELLSGEHRPKLLRAIDLLGDIGAFEAEQPLMDLLGHSNAKIRRPAIEAVGKIFVKRAPSQDTLLVMEAQLSSEPTRTCENALMNTLAGFPNRAGLPSLLRVCGESNELLIRRILVRLQRMLGHEPASVWEEAMQGLPDYTRQCVARCADFEPLLTIFKTPVAVEVEAPHELEGFGRIMGPSDHDLRFPQELIDAAVKRLNAQGPRHLLVVGPSGVGKSAFLEEVFKQIYGRGATVLRTTTSALMAGTKYIGEWQTRVQNLIAKSSQPKDVVLFIEDANHLPFTGVYEGSSANFASLMKPYMEDGIITVVGESTPEALTVGLGSKPDFRRLFSEIKLPEPDGEILRAQLDNVMERLSYENDRELTLPPTVREYLISLASSFVSGIAFPGKAVAILKGAAALIADEPDATTVTSDHLVRSVAQRTGLPIWLLEDKSPLDLVRAREFFTGHVVGQEEPVEAMVDLITLIKAGLTDPTRPLGVFLFVGPTGVGKTELAKSLAEFVFGSRERLLRVDMSEFKDYDSYRRLIGSQYGSDKDKEGLLTGKVKQNPFAVILLDEFEKAHPNVYDLMLGLFDDGRLTTAGGETVNFCNTVIIMTSNLGQAASSDSSLGILARTTQVSERDTMRAVEAYFSPEFINRIRVSMFRPLALPAMQMIARREMAEALGRNGIARRNLIVDADDSVVSLLLRRGFTPRYGARPLKRAVETLFLLPIARQLVKAPPDGGVMQVRATDDGVKARYLLEKTVEFQEARLPGGGTVQELEKRWNACSAQVLEQELEIEYGRLAEQAGGADFWEQEGARQIGARLHRLETLLGSWRSLGDQLAAFGGWLVSSAQIKGGNQRHAQAAKRYQELDSALDLMELKLRCREPLHQRDCYLRIRPLGPQLSGRDGLRTLLEMYRGWAARTDGDLLVLNDPAGEEEPTLALRVIGPQSFGLLRQEQGLHRLSVSSKGRRQSALLRVDVIPAAPADFSLPETEVHREGGAVRAGVPRYGRERPRSWVGLLHIETSTVAEGRNALDLAQNEEATREYLAALVAWSPTQGADTRIVRSYYFEPDNEVLDATSGLRSRRLENVLAGELEPFLLGAIASR